MKLFFSYARPDRPRADSLAQRLHQAGHEVWLDTDLSGGQVWWDKILDQVRGCDALVMMVSWASIKSQACKLERGYATQLGKAVLPVAIEQIRSEVLPTDIGRLQVIDYSQPSETAAFQLIGSIMRLPPTPPLPDPLPEPPAIPISYLAAVADRLSRPDLSRDDQFVLMGVLEEALGSSDPSDRASALQLLAEMEGRADLLAAVAKRIATLKSAAQGSGTSQSAGSAAGTGSAPGTGTGFRWQDRSKPGTQSWGGSTAGGARDHGSKESHTETAQPKREWQPSTQREWRPSPKPESQSSVKREWQPSAQRSQSRPSPQQQWQPPPPQPPPPQPPPPTQKQPTVIPVSQVIVAISPHWAMAVWSVVFCWPVGIFAVISAARVKPSVASGDLVAAQKASSRVKVLFWIALIVGIICWIIIGAASNSNSTNQ